MAAFIFLGKRRFFAIKKGVAMTYQDNKVSTWNQFWSYFQGYPQWFVEGSFALIVGFFVGFIAKNFGRSLLYTLIIIIIAGYIASYLGLADFHVEKMKALLGITEVPTVDVAFAQTLQWMKEHIALCIGACLGFVLGWRMGN
jgi:uncharacterized membrane protein (Fun14 family)